MRNNKNITENTSNIEDEFKNRFNNHTIKYPSSELLLSALQLETEKENERSKNLETRVGIFISLAGIMIAFISSFLKIPNLKEIKIQSVYDAVPYTILLIVLTIT